MRQHVFDCIRGHGSLTLQKFNPGDPESQDAGKCCSACLRAAPKCAAFQLIAKGHEAGRVLVDDYEPKTGNSGDNCTSAPVFSAAASALQPHGFSGVWVQHGSAGDLVAQDLSLAPTWTRIGRMWRWQTASSTGRRTTRRSPLRHATVFSLRRHWRSGPTARRGFTRARARIARCRACRSCPVGGTSPSRRSSPRTWTAPTSSCYARPSRLRRTSRLAAGRGTGRLVAVQAKFAAWRRLPVAWHAQDPRDAISAAWYNFTRPLPWYLPALRRAGSANLVEHQYIAPATAGPDVPGLVHQGRHDPHSFQVNCEPDNLWQGEIATLRATAAASRGPSLSMGTSQTTRYAPPTRALWQLTFGVDMPGLEPNLLNATYAPLYRDVFNRYAGSVYKRPSTGKDTAAVDASGWAGGIVMLRDGLDSADTARFPEAQYGTAEQGNQQRLLAIAADPRLKARGAVELDPAAAASGAMKSRRRQAPNDVGWRVHAGNYGNGLLTQLAPANSRVGGMWPAGPALWPLRAGL